MHPVEFVRGLLGTKVLVTLRDREEIRGSLKMFDEHFNLMVSDIEGHPAKEILFLRSDNVLSITEVA
ncbi:hypothetical protein NEDG_02103 [Nematocida displodere]|uniref:Sm domain-containing protein n=1 Tax=Nematocida displodere TaxID=1805483 RepID=A0A177EJM0_9MICR|nr:hypothetical protein NEDG_02103 [Nematocida displodere]